jgi:penicillin amidase
MSLTRLLLRLALGRRLPVTSGDLRVRGPAAPVTIRRDPHGVPHVDAASETDAAFALGFCQGQDRAAQLEVLWRVARGRLAEWVGPAGLPADRLSRRVGFRRAAEAQLPVVGPVAEHLAAFAAGVSAGNTAGLPKKPHEFALVGGEPSAWDAADVLAVLKLQSFALPSNWDVELARLRILLADGPDALRALDPATAGRTRSVSDGVGAPGRADVHPVADAPGSPDLDRLAADVAGLQQFLPTGGGSNNWVISGARTASGLPLVANDPHLAPTAPAPWYLAHVRCPEWEAAGACLAGTPGFPVGHNGFAAWGVTAGLTDNADLFVETVGPDGTSVRQPDGTFAACPVLREVIRVKGAADVVEEVLVTPRGPVVSPLAPDVTAALSLRAVWLDPLPLNGFLTAVRAKSFDEFRRCFAEWPVLPLNVVYADATGATGWQLVGQVPVRAGGNGLLPRPADRPDSGWTGYVPFEHMPYTADPPAGYFATANNPPPVPPGWAWLGADFCDPYRQRVIAEALASRTGWTVADCLALQRDVRSIPWEEVRDTVLSLTPAGPDARDAVELLRAWDGRVDSESPAACVFELFVAELAARAARAKAPRAWAVALGVGGDGPLDANLFGSRRVGHLVRLIREQPGGWFASWPAEMEGVLGEVVRRLRRTVGPGPAYWAWGHVRRVRVEHPLFKAHRWLGPAFNLGPVPHGGDENTVCQGAVVATDPTAFTPNIPNLRAVFDLADLAGGSRFVLCGGQSGNPWSPHHADQFPLWRAGEAVPVPWYQADVIRAATATLRLLPQPT